MNETATVNQPPSRPSRMQQVFGAARYALPLLQRLLPLLDGNLGTAVGNLLALPIAVPPVSLNSVELKSVEVALANLEKQQNNVSEQVAELNAVLLQIDERLEAAHEVAERNALAQKELHDDLRSLHVKVNLFAFVILCLLGLSTILSTLLYLHVGHPATWLP